MKPPCSPAGNWAMPDVRDDRCLTGFGWRCCGKPKIVGIAPSRKRTVCPVRSKHPSSKWDEHKTELSVAFQFSLRTFTTHCRRMSSSFRNLHKTYIHIFHVYLNIYMLLKSKLHSALLASFYMPSSIVHCPCPAAWHRKYAPLDIHTIRHVDKVNNEN